MAGLDTTIALGIKPVDFGDPNEGRMNALRAQMMQMQMQQGQFNMMKAQRDMEYQNQQRGAAAAEKARSGAAEKKFNALVPGYITPEGTTTYNARDVEDTTSPTAGLVNAEGIPDNVKSFTEKTPSKIDYQGIAAKAFALEGKYGREFAGKMFELGKKNEEFLKANEENTKKKLDDAYAQVGPLVMQAQTPQDIADWTRRLYSDPVLGPEARKLKTVDKAIQDNMQQFLQNPDQFKAVMGRMITGEKLYEITRRTPDIDKTTGFDTNYRSPTFGARMFEPPQTAGGKSNLDLDAAYRQQKQDEARAAALETQGDTTGAAAIREQAQARVDALKDQIEKATTIGGKGGGAQSDIGKLLADRDALDKADPEYDIKSRAYTRKIEELTGGKAKDIGTADAAIAAAEQNIKDIDKILNHKALKSNTGIGAWNPKQFVPGTDSKDFNLRLAQVQGEAFLSAFNILKGGGAITEIEGVKATRAINRMNNALSKDDFIEASNEAKEILERGIKQANDRKARNTWGGTSNAPATNAPAAAAPAAGGKVINFEDLK
jgi:hypothetical protein